MISSRNESNLSFNFNLNTRIYVYILSMLLNESAAYNITLQGVQILVC